MKIEFPEFIGRDSELTQIKEHLERHPGIAVINIVGSGGVGKTAILGELKKYYKVQPKTLVTDIIDFSQTVHQVQTWVIDQIVQTRPAAFQSYLQTRQEIESLPPTVRAFNERTMIKAFIDDYNAIIDQNTRFVLLFDTIELVQNTPLLSLIIETAADLKNIAVILAGRENDDEVFKKRLHEKFGRSAVLTIPLKGFTETEADLYFQETKNLPGLEKVGKKIRKNIFILSEGKPILIALALDWLDRGIPFMPEITTLDPAELQTQSDKALGPYRTRFEYGLMDAIRKLNSPVDQVVLTMAHLNKRFNRDMLEFFFRDSHSHLDFDHIIAQLQTLPFVKYISENYFVLHDEMIRMVVSHVWDATEDPGKIRRRALSVKACQYYDQKLKELALTPGKGDQITYWSHRVEQIYYHLYADFEAGYYAFEALFETLVDSHRGELAALAVKFLEEFKGHPKYTELLKTFVNGYFRGGVLLALQRLEEAEETLVAGEQQLKETMAQLKSPQPLDLYLSERQYLVYHQLGFCYRSLGEWAQAITHYHKSLDWALQLLQSASETIEKQSLLSQIAETLNSLANVQRLVGQFDEARLLCQIGIFLRQTWEPQEVARSQYVMAMILWEMGGTAEAIGYLRQAEQSCPPTEEITRALIKRHRAYIYFRAGLAERAVPLLHEAEAVFRQRGQYSELANVLIMLSRICRDHPDAIRAEFAGRNKMEVAKDYVDEAHLIAEQIGDKFRLAECYITKAYHYHQWSQLESSKYKTYRDEAVSNWRIGVGLARGHYDRFLSHFSQVRGDIAFQSPKPDYKLAFYEYVEQCKLATRFKRAAYERAIDGLGERLRSLGHLEPDKTKGYIRQIISSWQQEQQLKDNYPEIIDELNEIRKSIEERKKLTQLKSDYQQAMRQGKWTEAIEHCNDILEIASLYDDANRAGVILDMFRAAHRQGDLSQARRLAKIVRQIGQELDEPALIAQAHLAMAQVLWDTTSTAECAAHLKQAESIFGETEDEIGLAKVTRQRSYILFRTGIYEEPKKKLLEIAKIFESQNTEESKEELAFIYNVLSRIDRTDAQNTDYSQARQYAETGLEYALSIQDSYRIAECYLSLAILAHREEKYHEVLRFCKEGLKWVSDEMNLLRSVYQGIRGAAFLNLGLAADVPEQQSAHWDQAFDAFIQELIESSLTKPASMVRATGLICGFFMDVPLEATEKYANQVQGAWKREILDQKYPIVIRMCEEVIRYRPYIHIGASRKDI